MYEGVSVGLYAPTQGCMVARVARIRGNRLQVVADELPENLSCVAYPPLHHKTLHRTKERERTNVAILSLLVGDTSGTVWSD